MDNLLPQKIDINRETAALAFQCPIFGAALAMLSFVSDTSVKTYSLSVTGRVRYNPEWLNKIDRGDLRSILLRECLRIMLLHPFRRKGRDKRLWNWATDLESSVELAQYVDRVASKLQGKTGTQGEKSFAIYVSKVELSLFQGLSAEEIYIVLKNEVAANGWKPGPRQIEFSPQQGAKRKGTLIVPKADTTNGAEEEGESTGNGGKQGKGGKGNKSQHNPSNLQEGESIDDMPLADATLLQERLKQLAEVSASLAQPHERGWMPAGLKLGQQKAAEVRIHWEEYLTKWLGNCPGKKRRTYRREGRREMPSEYFAPGAVKQQLPDVYVFLDTSGSMFGDLKTIIAGMRSLIESLNMEVKFLCCDAAVHAKGLVSDADEIELVGGGGSNFVPAFDEIEKEGFSGVLIAWTDGYITVPEKKPDQLQGVLWCITSHGVAPATWGQAIYIDPQGYAGNERSI